MVSAKRLVISQFILMAVVAVSSAVEFVSASVMPHKSFMGIVIFGTIIVLSWWTHPSQGYSLKSAAEYFRLGWGSLLFSGGIPIWAYSHFSEVDYVTPHGAEPVPGWMFFMAVATGFLLLSPELVGVIPAERHEAVPQSDA